MISIADALKELIEGYPFIEEGLIKGLINYSAYAREVKPEIEKRLYKSIKTGAIVMALKRLSEDLKLIQQRTTSVNLGGLTVRSNVSEYTFLNSEALIDKQRELFNQIATQKDVFCAVSQGVRETTFIASAEAAQIIERVFSSEELVAKIEHLSSITIHLPQETVYISGVYYQILKALAWEKINVIEVLSTLSELTVIFENKDINQAFSALKKLDSLSK